MRRKYSRSNQGLPLPDNRLAAAATRQKPIFPKITARGKALVAKTKELPAELRTLAATGSTLTLIPPGAFSTDADRPIWKKVLGLA